MILKKVHVILFRFFQESAAISCAGTAAVAASLVSTVTTVAIVDNDNFEWIFIILLDSCGVFARPGLSSIVSEMTI